MNIKLLMRIDGAASRYRPWRVIGQQLYRLLRLFNGILRH